MASDANKIKEFLVALGFKVDEDSFVRFSSKLGAVTASAAEAGVAVVAAALAIETFTVKIARAFDNLYFASQRIGSSVQSIQGYEFAIQSMGGTAASARGALEGLAAAMRTNPGVAALVQNLTGQAVGGRDRVAIMADLARRFSEMPYFIAQRYASQVGIDEATLWQMTHNLPQFLRSLSEPGRLYGLAGLNPNAVADRMHGFSVQFRVLEYSFETLATVLGDRLLPIAERMTEWMQRQVELLLSGNSALNKWLDALDWTAIRKETDYIKSILTDVGDYFGKVNWMSIANDVVMGFNLVKKGAEVFYDYVQFILGAMGVGGDHTAGDITEPNEIPSGPVGWGEAWRRQNQGDKSIAGALGKFKGSLLDLVRSLENSADNAISSAGAVGRYQIKVSTAQQYGFKDATVDKLKDPDYNAQVATAILLSLWNKSGGSLEKTLLAYNQGSGWLDPKWLAAHNASLQGIPNEAAKYINHERRLTGIGSPITIHAKTDVHVSGAGDPKAVAQAVGAYQTRVFGDLLRNLRPVVQ